MYGNEVQNYCVEINNSEYEKEYGVTTIAVLNDDFLAATINNNSIKANGEDDKAVLGRNNEVITTFRNNKNRIAVNGILIVDGEKLFIPWNPEKEDKIYHWTDVTGKTYWELPHSWSNITSLVLYELSDIGILNKTIIKVIDGSVVLNTKANTPYVLYKEEVEETRDMEWGKGSPVKDMGFDSHTGGYSWNKTSNFENTDHINFVNNEKGNTHIRICGNNGVGGSITQTLTSLKGGQTYSASVWVEVSQGRKAEISVITKEGKVFSNYTYGSNVIYGSTHSDKLNTYYERVKLIFTQPQGESFADLKLTAGIGEKDSCVNFDDVRVCEVGVTDKEKHYFYEDFENVDQGYGPFESTSSDNSHLSETNKLYTEDTINGKYSLKICKGNYMRTLSHRLRFKPNTEYKVGLSHLSHADGAFILGVKSDKANEVGDSANAVIVNRIVSQSGKVEVHFTTGNYSDYYIDITKNNAEEYVIDDLYVDEF